MPIISADRYYPPLEADNIVLEAAGWQDPGDNVAQRAFLHSFRSENYYMAGRGSGKTAVACKKAEIICIESPGIIVMITEQTNGDIDDILKPSWEEVVTPGIWQYKHSRKGINIEFTNGSQVWFRSRQAKRINDDPPFRGPTIGWCIHDELSQDRREDVLEISQMMLRQKGVKYLGFDVITTPKPGWLTRRRTALGLNEPRNWETGENQIQVSDDNTQAAFYGRTIHNAYNRNLDQRMRGTLSTEHAAQELDADDVSVTGRCWNFVEKQWPEGNLLDRGFDRSKEWILSLDFGPVESAWGIWQFERVNGKTLFVLKAEWTPHGNKKPWVVLREIQEFTSHGIYKNPLKIHMGHDLNSPGGPSAETADMMFAKLKPRWDRYVDAISSDRWEFRKHVQDMQLSYLLCNSNNHRTLCISSKLKSFYTEKGRGVTEMFRHDTYPDPGSKDHFRKEKSKGIFYEDSRDMVLYAAVGVYPPKYESQEHWGV